MDRVTQHIRTALSRFEPVHNDWEQLRKLYDSELRRPDIQDSWQPDIDIPITWERASAQIARIVNVVVVQEPVWVARSTQSAELARAAENYLQWKVRTWHDVGGTDFPSWLSELMRHVMVYGIGIVHVFVRREFAPAVVRRAVTAPLSDDEAQMLRAVQPFPEFGAVSGFKRIETLEVEQRPRYRGAKAEVVEPRDFFWLPIDASSLESCWFVARRHWLSPWQVKDAAAAGFFDHSAAEQAIKQPGPFSTLQENESSDVSTSRPKDGLIEIWEVYRREKEEEFSPVVTWCAPKADVILRDEPNMLSEFQLPFVIFRYEWRASMLAGRSFAKRIEGIHHAITGSLNLELESAILANSVAMATDDDEIFDELSERRIRPGEVIRTTRPPREALQPIQLSSGFTQLPILRQYLEQHADMMSAASPSLFGIEQAQRPTARGTVALIQEAQQPLYRQIEAMRTSLALVARHILVREAEEFDFSIPFFTLSDDGVVIRDAMLYLGRDFATQLIVELNASSESLSRATKLQELNDSLDRVMQIYQQILGLVMQANPGTNPMWEIYALAADNLSTLAARVLKEFGVPGAESLRLPVLEVVNAAVQSGQAVQAAQGPAQPGWLQGALGGAQGGNVPGTPVPGGEGGGPGTTGGFGGPVL